MEENTEEQKSSTIEEQFDNFLNTSTEHSFENNQAETETETETTEQPNNEAPPIENNLSFADEFKVTMFIGFIFMFLDGIHAFAYQFISKYKFDKKELAMDKEDKEALEMYFKTPRVAAILNKIPTEIIGLVHMEYIYWQKFQEIMERKKEEEEYTKEVEEDSGKSMTPEQMEAFMNQWMKKQSAKKKPVKKKEVKKAVKKTATKKNE